MRWLSFPFLERRAVMLAILNGPFAAWGVVDFLILIVVIAACVGLMYVALQQFGVAIPPFVVKCFWIVVCAALVIFCIRLVASM
jgi:hypothetical protein